MRLDAGNALFHAAMPICVHVRAQRCVLFGRNY